MYIKVDAPKNRGDFNDCLPYENLYIVPVIIFKQSGNRHYNYLAFFAEESIFLAEESIFLTAESIFLLVESTGVTTVESIFTTVVESVLVSVLVSVPLLQAVKAAAITHTKSTFFIFRVLICYLYLLIQSLKKGNPTFLKNFFHCFGLLLHPLTY
jgi:hypothetical protein